MQITTQGTKATIRLIILRRSKCEQMLINEMPLKKEPSYNFDNLAPKERIIFFDIETTGLSPSNSHIYLIGAVFFDNGGWKLKQFFAESMHEEAKLIESFFALVDERRRLGRIFLISFNGDGFDIPFIKNCIRQYALPYDFSQTLSIDLYKYIKPYKKLAGLDNCRLKSVERLCGIYREDRYGGGELIYVYEEYLRLSGLGEGSCEYNEQNMRLKDALLKSLLLHNAEDIMDMPMVMDILGYDSLIAGGNYAVTKSLIADGVWDIHARLMTPLPRGIYREDEQLVLSISEEDKLELNITVNVYEGELKSFYADYKSYYYLPAEDYAIHKSLGEFVDRKQRRQATARNCYQKVSGCFIPETEPIFAPMFYREYKALPGYGRIDTSGEGAFTAEESGIRVEAEHTKRYIKSVLSALL